MRSALMSEWLSSDVPDLWECVDQVTYGTPDEDEDVLILSHARVELRARWGLRPQPPAEARSADVTAFPDIVHRRKVG